MYSDNFEDHLWDVIYRLRSAGLNDNLEKIKFAQEKISFLGHVISHKEVTIDPERIQGNRDFPPPSDATGVAGFAGMVTFPRCFIPNAAEMSVPLNELRKKGAKFVWEERQQKDFEMLKEALVSPPVSRMPDFCKPFITD